MPLSHLARMPRRLQISLVLFAIITTGFFGAAMFAVWNGGEENKDICDAVVGLREDIVEVISEQRGRAIENAEKLGLDTDSLNRDYDKMLSKIGDRSCP